MPNHEHPTGAAVALLERRSEESLPFRLKLQLIEPLDVETLAATLARLRDDAPDEIDCGTCGAALPLEERSFDWPLGAYYVYFQAVPSYRCDFCNRTFFTAPIRDVLALAVEQAVAAQGPSSVVRNPRAIAYARRFAARQQLLSPVP